MKRANPTSQAGFSLVETVAAMGILALAAIPLMQITGDAVRNSSSLETRLLARTVAENVMARSMVSPEILDAGIATGKETQMGRVFDWALTKGPAQAGGLQNLEITVRREEEEQVLARLVSLKYIPQNLPDRPDATPPAESGDNTDGEPK